MLWESPSMLWWAALLGPLAAWAWWDQRTEAAGRARLAPGRVGRSGRRRAWAAGCGLVGALVACMVLARPAGGEGMEPGDGLDVFVLLDVSRSTTARDLDPSRLQKAQRDLLLGTERFAAARFGLILFAGEAKLSAPLTSDRSAYEDRVLDARATEMKVGGTALGPAIDAALARLGGPGRTSVLVVLGDGEDHRPQELDAALERARAAGVPLFGVAYGEPVEVPLPGGDQELLSRARPSDLAAWCVRAEGRMVDGSRPDPWAELADHLYEVARDRGPPPAPGSQGGYSVLGIALILLCWWIESWGRRP